MDKNLVSWFEIPVIDMNRAKQFYDAVFEINIAIHDLEGLQMGWFPMNPEKSGASGSLVKHKEYIPSETHGPVLYFSCLDVVNELSRVEAAGGSILKPKTGIGGGYGFMALVKDTEGNRIALHSNQ
ncbi:VOC family protein [Maribacter sp. CXY002]|uniref:VOC family protein n=1 Tax=Maribacter luteocoastalis TaxID=3407671 RepID=UPI003B6789A9